MGMRILLAGTHRCGSTWVANVLGRSPDVLNVFEPDSPKTDILGTVTTNRLGEYPALDPEQRSFWYSMVWDLAFRGGWPWSRSPSARRMGRGLVRVPPAVRDYGVAALARGIATIRSRPAHVVIKSVNSAFTLEWIARRYQPRIVILRRNPLNVVSSWLVLNIEGEPDLPARRLVRERWLEPLGVPPRPAHSKVASTAWDVGVLMCALRASAERHPDWMVVSHDELSASPEELFPSLFNELGLPWTDEARAYLRASDEPGFVVRGVSRPGRHPNEQTATDDGRSRRLQQSSQYKRRLSAEQVAEATAVLAAMPLGSWGVPHTEP
ncbi:MAG: hypothetical protein E6J45_07360 [Chloroflexi bacterium]|nr:MAG: hypothetical protein E6J45_07360 [Chloroflexota bacterium]